MNQIRISNHTGLGRNTIITDIDTGKQIRYVSSAVLYMDANEVNKVELEFALPQVDSVAELILSEDQRDFIKKLYAVVKRMELEERRERQND